MNRESEKLFIASNGSTTTYKSIFVDVKKEKMVQQTPATFFFVITFFHIIIYYNILFAILTFISIKLKLAW